MGTVCCYILAVEIMYASDIPLTNITHVLKNDIVTFFPRKKIYIFPPTKISRSPITCLLDTLFFSSANQKHLMRIMATGCPRLGGQPQIRNLPGEFLREADYVEKLWPFTLSGSAPPLDMATGPWGVRGTLLKSME